MANAREVARHLTDFTAGKITNFTLDLAQALEDTTPIDSGFARKSWRPSSGAPEQAEPEHPDSTGTTREQAAAAQGAKQSAAQTVFRANRKIEDKHILNSAVYIEELNAGKSSQAPSGFVETVIDVYTD